MISVIIATSDRDATIIKTIRSIQKTVGVRYEIVIIDQSSNAKTERCVRAYADKNIRYKRVHQKNKSNALNLGMRLARGDIFAFTDDDCVVAKSWLLSIQSAFAANPTVGGMFGTTAPYQPTFLPNTQCVSIIRQRKKMILTHPKNHNSVGYGNNMAWRKTVCTQSMFPTMLGPGSLGKNAEDAYVTMRHLIEGTTILLNKQMVVYHDHWLTDKALDKQNYIYVFAEMVCYTQFGLAGWKFAKRVIQKNWSDMMQELRSIGGDVGKRSLWAPHRWEQIMRMCYARIGGYLLGVVWWVITDHKEIRSPMRTNF